VGQGDERGAVVVDGGVSAAAEVAPQGVDAGSKREPGGGESLAGVLQLGRGREIYGILGWIG
jgi:hypothetical protein